MTAGETLPGYLSAQQALAYLAFGDVNALSAPMHKFPSVWPACLKLGEKFGLWIKELHAQKRARNEVLKRFHANWTEVTNREIEEGLCTQDEADERIICGIADLNATLADADAEWQRREAAISDAEQKLRGLAATGRVPVFGRRFNRIQGDVTQFDPTRIPPPTFTLRHRCITVDGLLTMDDHLPPEELARWRKQPSPDWAELMIDRASLLMFSQTPDAAAQVGQQGLNSPSPNANGPNPVSPLPRIIAENDKGSQSNSKKAHGPRGPRPALLDRISAQMCVEFADNPQVLAVEKGEVLASTYRASISTVRRARLDALRNLNNVDVKPEIT